MTTHGRSFFCDELFENARAKVIAQEAKLAALLPNDPQRKYEERVLRSMIQNAAVAHLASSLAKTGE